MCFSWLILCTCFFFQLCLIFSFFIFCRYCVAQILTLLSHLSGTARGKRPSQHFSMVSFAWNRRKEKIEINSSLWPCSLSHLNHVRWETILVVFLCSRLFFQGGKKPIFWGGCSTFDQKICLASFAALTHLSPHVFSYVICASKSSGFHRMKTVRQTR